jgi:phage tail sheath gpL-like
MTLTALPQAATFAAIVVASVTAAVAQTLSADPHHSDMTVAQATLPSLPPPPRRDHRRDKASNPAKSACSIGLAPGKQQLVGDAVALRRRIGQPRC